MLSSYWDSEQLDVRVLEVSGGELTEINLRRRATFDQSSENNQNSSKTPLRIWIDFDLFQKIMVTDMRISFVKKVQKITFSQNVVEWLNVKRLGFEISNEK